MYCEYCLETNRKIELIKFSDAYSCPHCYRVSNEIVFGGCAYNNDFLHYNKKKCVNDDIYNQTKYIEKTNPDIDNVCTFYQLAKIISTKSNRNYFKMIKQKKKSCYSLNYYKAFSILKTCNEERIYLEPQKICDTFHLNFSKFLKFQKYSLIKKLGYFQPPDILLECAKLLNILDVKNYKTIQLLTSITLNKLKKTDINVKIILLHVYCDYFEIKPKSVCFRNVCLKLRVNYHISIKYCNKISCL